MARLAGRKKDGAWFRTNKWLKGHDENATELTNMLQDDARVQALAAAYADIINLTGLPSEDPNTYISQWVTKGIPREVWMGYSRFDTLEVVPGKTYRRRVHGKTIRNGAYALREIITNWRQAQEMMKDLMNTESKQAGNPGGVADAIKDT